jgi:hypothetical protein
VIAGIRSESHVTQKQVSRGPSTNWTARVNAQLTARELDRVRVSIDRGRLYNGDE